MSREFGNTLRDLRGLLIFSVILAVLLLAFFLGTAWYHGRLAGNWGNLLLFPVLIGAIVPVFVLPTCLFSIRVGEGKIAHFLCRKVKLSEGDLSQLTAVEVGFSAGAKFHFANRRPISMLGAKLQTLEQMCLYIRELRPDFDQFRFGARAAFMLRTFQLIESKRQGKGA